MTRFQILSLIGGGIRGSFVTSYLNRIEQKLGRPVSESFDLIAGTSTGAIIAAALASGIPAAEVHDFYVQHGASIFTPRPKYRAKRLMKFLFPPANWVFRRRTGSGLDAAFRARFCPHALEAALDNGFGQRTMGDVANTRLIIPAVDLTQGRPHVFRSRHLPLGIQDQDLKVVDVLIAATAAPTYFPHRQIKKRAFVDGGLWAVDPSMLALAETAHIRRLSNHTETNLQLNTSEVSLLSIGTGRAQFSWTPPGGDAGILYWAPRVADVMSTAQVEGIHIPLKFLLGDRYRHVNFQMDEIWSLDGVENMPELFRKGEQVADDTFDVINQEFLQHRRERFQPFTDMEKRTDGRLILYFSGRCSFKPLRQARISDATSSGSCVFLVRNATRVC